MFFIFYTFVIKNKSVVYRLPVLIHLLSSFWDNVIRLFKTQVVKVVLYEYTICVML